MCSGVLPQWEWLYWLMRNVRATDTCKKFDTHKIYQEKIICISNLLFYLIGARNVFVAEDLYMMRNFVGCIFLCPYSTVSPILSLETNKSIYLFFFLKP